MKEFYIELPDNIAMVLVRQESSIVEYKIQCAGMSCLLKKVKGFVLSAVRCEDLASICTYGNLSCQDKELIESWFKNNEYLFTYLGMVDIELDLESSVESFVQFSCIHCELGYVNCVLTWENSD